MTILNQISKMLLEINPDLLERLKEKKRKDMFDTFAAFSNSNDDSDKKQSHINPDLLERLRERKRQNTIYSRPEEPSKKQSHINPDLLERLRERKRQKESNPNIDEMRRKAFRRINRSVRHNLFYKKQLKRNPRM